MLNKLILSLGIAMAVVSCANSPTIKQGIIGRTPNNSPVRWQLADLPIPLFVIELNDPDLVSATAEAASYINRKVGMHLFMPIAQSQINKYFKVSTIVMSVTIRRGGMRAKSIGMTRLAYSQDTGRIIAARIDMHKRIGGHLLRIAVVHELLHAVGVRHSKNKHAIMYPSLDSPSQSLQPETIAAVRHSYGRRTNFTPSFKSVSTANWGI